MDLAALIEGTPDTRCPCLTDESVHYQAERLLIMSILYAEHWRARIPIQMERARRGRSRVVYSSRRPPLDVLACHKPGGGRYGVLAL